MSFFMVYRQGGNHPSVEHLTQEDAEKDFC